MSTFAELRGAMFRLYGEQRYADALALVERESARFPERWGDTLYWIACLAAVTGDRSRALRELGEALSRGFWWSEGMLRGDPDLQPLQGVPEFEAMVATCTRRHEAAQAGSSPQLLVRRPTRASPHPLLIALHGAGGNAVEFSEYWAPAVAEGWVVAVPQSSRMVAPGRFAWSDRLYARDEIREHYTGLMREPGMDLGRVVLAGFSQGGSTAIWLAATGVIPCHGFLGLACAARDLEELGAALEARPRRLRSYLIVGRQDYVSDRTRALADLLRNLALPIELETPEGLGHEVPPDLERRLGHVLGFLTSH